MKIKIVINLLPNKFFLLSLHLKNCQNFKGDMSNGHSKIETDTLRSRIEVMPEDSILFRSDFP